jgi:hypothetical protein
MIIRPFAPAMKRPAMLQNVLAVVLPGTKRKAIKIPIDRPASAEITNVRLIRLKYQ